MIWDVPYCAYSCETVCEFISFSAHRHIVTLHNHSTTCCTPRPPRHYFTTSQLNFTFCCCALWCAVLCTVPFIVMASFSLFSLLAMLSSSALGVSALPTVSFRLDDVQAWWCEDIVKNIVDEFLFLGVPLNLGLIGNGGKLCWYKRIECGVWRCR